VAEQRLFELRTDHKTLEYSWSTQNTNILEFIWALELQEYSFKVKFVKREDNVADRLNRQSVVLAAAEIKEKFTASQKNKILAEYHLIAGHGTINNIEFLLKGKYIGSSYIKISKISAYFWYLFAK
jgi:hypothetical protein